MNQGEPDTTFKSLEKNTFEKFTAKKVFVSEGALQTHLTVH